MSTSPAAAAATPPSTPPPSPSTEAVDGDQHNDGGTIAVLLCDGCRSPIGSLWDVLPAEETAPVWKQHVYSYELDLFNNGATPIQAYSATNPSARRFDLLRLAPQVTVHRPADANARRTTAASTATPAASTTVLAPSFVECDTTVYSTEHSFFTGYAWCFAHCGNCGAFLGWGFAAESRLRAAQRLAQDRHRQQEEEEEEEAEEDGSRDSGRLRERAERRADGDDSHAGAQEAGTNLRDRDPTHRADASHGPASSSPPRDGAAAEAPHTAAEAGDGHRATRTSTTDGVAAHESDKDVAERAGPHELVNTVGVTPDFIGIVITHCTGEPDYSVTALLRDVEWRAARQRRCSAVATLRQRLRSLLVQMSDGYRAHQLFHDFNTVEQLTYTVPPQSSSSSSTGHLNTVASVTNAAVTALLANVDDDGVPVRLHAAVQSARVAIARQQQQQPRQPSRHDGNGTRARSSSTRDTSSESESDVSEVDTGSS